MPLSERIFRFLRRTTFRAYWSVRKLLWATKPAVRHARRFVTESFSRTIRWFRRWGRRTKQCIHDTNRQTYFMCKIIGTYILFLFRLSWRGAKHTSYALWKKSFIHNFWILAGSTIKERCAYYLNLVRDLLGSLRIPTEKCTRVKTFCFFIGYSRSGNSLIGSLLDAHPNALIAHEADATGLVKLGFSRMRIMKFLAANSARYARAKRFVSGYSYFVSESMQGASSNLQVIGDKESPLTSLRFYFDKKLFARCKQRMGLPFKGIHLTRNPYDTIATMAMRERQKRHAHATYADVTEADLRQALKSFFFLVRATEAFLEQEKPDVCTLTHEDFIADPVKSLRTLCAFLDVPADDAYIQRCAAIVFKEAHRSRTKVTWPEHLKEEIATRIAQTSFLRHYTYHG